MFILCRHICMIDVDVSSLQMLFHGKGVWKGIPPPNGFPFKIWYMIPGIYVPRHLKLLQKNTQETQPFASPKTPWYDSNKLQMLWSSFTYTQCIAVCVTISLSTFLSIKPIKTWVTWWKFPPAVVPSGGGFCFGCRSYLAGPGWANQGCHQRLLAPCWVENWTYERLEIEHYYKVEENDLYYLYQTFVGFPATSWMFDIPNLA